MKQLTCEMCGSTDLLKQDGVFVCQTCGTKYSVEEAKKMMIEGTVNVSGTVKVDNTDKIKNYLEMAKSAYEAGNKSEAEAYCNRILEIEPQNYEAWFMKGESAGWQTTIANIRIDESCQCFSKAIDYASDNEKTAIQSKAADEITAMSLALISLALENFEKSPSTVAAKSVETCANSTKDAIHSLLDIFAEELYYVEASNRMNNTAVDVYKTSRESARLMRSIGRYESDHHLECSHLLEIAIRFAHGDYEGNIRRYNNLLIIAENDSFSGGYIGELRQKVEEYKKAAEKGIEERENRKRAAEAIMIAEQESRIAAYWDAHAEEKQHLETELDTLQNQLNQLQEQVAPYNYEILKWKTKRKAETPAQEEKKKLEEQISDLRTEKNNLGIFKGKEKKALQAQIDELISRLPAINESIEAEEKEQIKLCNDKIREIEQQAKPIKDKIAAAEKRINEIKAELTKNR